MDVNKAGKHSSNIHQEELEQARYAPSLKCAKQTVDETKSL